MQYSRQGFMKADYRGTITFLNLLAMLLLTLRTQILDLFLAQKVNRDVMGRDTPIELLVAWEEERGHSWNSKEGRRKVQSNRLPQPLIYVSDDISVPLPLPREKQRASMAKGIYLICHTSKTQPKAGEDEMPDLHSLSTSTSLHCKGCTFELFPCTSMGMGRLIFFLPYISLVIIF